MWVQYSNLLNQIIIVFQMRRVALRWVTFSVLKVEEFLSPAPSQKLKTESQILGVKARRSLSNYCKASRRWEGKGVREGLNIHAHNSERELFISYPFHPANPSFSITLFPLPQLSKQMPHLPQHFKKQTQLRLIPVAVTKTSAVGMSVVASCHVGIINY